MRTAPLNVYLQLVLRELLHPRTWKPSEDRSFILNAEQINELCDEAERIFRDEPTVLQLQGAEKKGRRRRGRGVGAPILREGWVPLFLRIAVLRVRTARQHRSFLRASHARVRR